ncbi:MAG: hypothetical protein KatS3mg038_1540 [Candidatus Kapaibacterium sp.]|nr:MAG: hypothetical protein KatS3mg038_1540 [Candidatus Kapabacteria bacterium]
MAEWTLFKMRNGHDDEPVVTVVNVPADVPQWKIRRGLRQHGYNTGWGSDELYYLALNSPRRAETKIDYSELQTEKDVIATSLRIPQPLHQQLSELSFRTGESLNFLINEAIRQFLLAQQEKQP